jgi:phosphatidylserine decarboxylase
LDPAGRNYVAAATVAFAISYAMGWGWLWPPILALLLVLLFFFRDPPRRIPRIPGAVVAPADGKVDRIYTNHNPQAGPVGGTCVSIFLSVLDVHVNRAPCDGTIEEVRPRAGVYHDARSILSASENKANWIFMRAGEDRVTVVQIAGMIARQIVCRVRPGQRVRRGQRIGIIRFSSRTDLYLPPEARIQVELDQKVRGGASIIAYLPVD